MTTPLGPNDLLSTVTVTDPQLAADGTVYVRRLQPDRELEANRSAIWRVDPTGLLAAFTSGSNDRMPRVSPDGKMLAFVGDRDGQPRVWTIATDGGEAQARSAAYARITALCWSPDGTRLAWCAAAARDPATARIYHDAPSGARHIRSLPFKSDADGLLDGLRGHLFVLDLRDGACVQVTSGDFDVLRPAWSPDGSRIAFAAAIGLPEWSFLTDIHVVEIATGERRMLTRQSGPMNAPSWSPDGASLAFLGHEHGDDVGGRFDTEVLLIAAEGGAIVSLSASLDRTAGNALIGDLRSGVADTAPAWSADNREIFAQISDEGTCTVRAFARDGSGSRLVAGGERDIFGFSLGRDGLAIVYSTPTLPAEVGIVAFDGTERRVTELNPWLDGKRLAVPRRLRPLAADGTRLDGWLLVPPDGVAPLPLVLEVHGGPHGAYGFGFFFEFQMLMGTGCAVAYGNPRGGQSYGAAYADAITGDWGGIDADDVLCILDAAQAAAAIDPARIGVAGGSYGGFMATWLLGHSDRFAAGVSMRAVNDFVSEVGASDVGWFLERELRAPPVWSDGGRVLFEGSPLRAVAHIAAPLLVEHSERDYRCPIDQGEQLFTALRRLGRTSVEFVRFTGDGHELSRGGKPRNRILRLRAIAHWFIRHLRPAGAVAVADEAGALFRPLAGETPLDTGSGESSDVV